MFKKLTKFIIKQTDSSKELVPVRNFADHEHFRPLCLLKKLKKKKTIIEPAPKYQQTQLKLDDVLLPGEDGKSTESLLLVKDVGDSSQFTLNTADQVDGAANFDTPIGTVASGGMKGGGSSSKEFSITPRKKAISLQSLSELSEKRQINMNHRFIQQLLKSDFNLYVVCEILETSEETVYNESSKIDGSINIKAYATLSAKGTRDKKQGIVIPKGCTLAFKAIQLDISNGEWYPDYFAGETTRSMLCSIEDPPQGKLQLAVREVEQYCAIFSEFSSGLRVMLLNTITAVMRDSDLFEELSQKMENVLGETAGYELKTESPDLKDLFWIFKTSPRNHCFRLAEGITYTLDALAELLEDQLLLLLQSLERKIMSQQLKLVENLLEHDLEVMNEPFRVDARLLSFPSQEEQSLTMDLVKLSGVKLQEDGSAVPIEQPFKAVVALYIALYVLNLLSGSRSVALGLAQGTTWQISAHRPLLSLNSLLVNTQGRFGWHMQM